MPIHLDEHQTQIEVESGTIKSAILAHLYQNTDLGFQPSEIGEELGIEQRRAAAVLTNLFKLGYLGKTADRYFHALEHRENLDEYVNGLDSPYEFEDSISESDSTQAIDEKALESEVEKLDAELEEELD